VLVILIFAQICVIIIVAVYHVQVSKLFRLVFFCHHHHHRFV